ncbi:hypothetical protein BD560DRAFT_77683 [Blakeslea trispora]|nr:hypothetical protein BD560DRAFT_77683 [Blakeslea trispora]
MDIRDVAQNRTVTGLYDLMGIVLDRLARIESFQERLMRIETSLEKEKIARINSQMHADANQKQHNANPPFVSMTGLSLDLFPKFVASPSSPTIADTVKAISDNQQLSETVCLGSDLEGSLSDFEGTPQPDIACPASQESYREVNIVHSTPRHQKRKGGRRRRKVQSKTNEPPVPKGMDDYTCDIKMISQLILLSLFFVLFLEVLLAKIKSEKTKNRFIQFGDLRNFTTAKATRLQQLLMAQGDVSIDRAIIMSLEIRSLCAEFMQGLDPIEFNNKSKESELCATLEQLVDTQYQAEGIHLSHCVNHWAIKSVIKPIINNMNSERYKNRGTKRTAARKDPGPTKRQPMVVPA